MSFELDPGIGLQLRGKGIKIQEWDGSQWVDKWVVTAEGNLTVAGTADITGKLTLANDLQVDGDSVFSGPVSAYDGIGINGGTYSGAALYAHSGDIRTNSGAFVTETVQTLMGTGLMQWFTPSWNSVYLISITNDLNDNRRFFGLVMKNRGDPIIVTLNSSLANSPAISVSSGSIYLHRDCVGTDTSEYMRATATKIGT